MTPLANDDKGLAIREADSPIHDIVEKDRILLPDLVLFVDHLVLQRLLVRLGHLCWRVSEARCLLVLELKARERTNVVHLCQTADSCAASGILLKWDCKSSKAGGGCSCSEVSSLGTRLSR